MKRKFPEPHAGSRTRNARRSTSALRNSRTFCWPHQCARPWLDDCRADDFADIELAREMRAECVAFVASHLFALLVTAGVHAILEQRAEDFRTHVGPIFRSRFAKAVCFGALEVNWIDDGKQSSIEILNVDESTASRFSRGRHLAK